MIGGQVQEGRTGAPAMDTFEEETGAAVRFEEKSFEQIRTTSSAPPCRPRDSARWYREPTRTRRIPEPEVR